MKAIVFDADGVLIGGKDESGEYLWQKNIGTDLGIRPDQIGQIFSGDWSLVLKGFVDTQRYFNAVLAQYISFIITSADDGPIPVVTMLIGNPSFVFPVIVRSPL